MAMFSILLISSGACVREAYAYKFQSSLKGRDEERYKVHIYSLFFIAQLLSAPEIPHKIA